jgi:hypothetical protein
MRETRQSGSEGGGARMTGSPYPYRTSTVPRQMARTSRAMTGEETTSALSTNLF